MYGPAEADLMSANCPKAESTRVKASRDPMHRFTNLYDLLHWDKRIPCALSMVGPRHRVRWRAECG